MARIQIGDGMLFVELSPLERAGAFHGSLSIPLAAVRGARIVDRPFVHLRGIRAPGTGFPGVIALGTWRRRGGKDFAAVYGRKPAVLIELRGAEYDRLLLSQSDPGALASRLSRLAGA